MRISKNHYHWLENNLRVFANKLSIDHDILLGCISAHGDKCYGYESRWENVGIPFEMGVAIYLASYIYPYSRTVRNTNHGWVDPCDWVIYQWEMGWSEFLKNKVWVTNLPNEYESFVQYCIDKSCLNGELWIDYFAFKDGNPVPECFALYKKSNSNISLFWEYYHRILS